MSPLLVEMMQKKARELARERKISRTIFKASKGWVKTFYEPLGVVTALLDFGV